MPSQSPTFLLAKNLRSLGGTAGRRGWTEDGPERGEPAGRGREPGVELTTVRRKA